MTLKIREDKGKKTVWRDGMGWDGVRGLKEGERKAGREGRR